MNTQNIRTSIELKDTFKELDRKFLAESRERLSKESEENEDILNSLNDDAFELRKNLLILVGTIFGSSIALATGRNVNNFFIAGEFFLFLSIASGIAILMVHLKAKEWDYAFSSKNSLESYLILNKNKIEDFELKSTEDLIVRYKDIIKKNQSGFLYKILKLIKLEKWADIFTVTFLIGLFLIFLSLITKLNIS